MKLHTARNTRDGMQMGYTACEVPYDCEVNKDDLDFEDNWEEILGIYDIEGIQLACSTAFRKQKG
jgi:hypothetical protein